MALPQFYGLTGSPLETWFRSFLNTGLEFRDYYPSPGQIDLNKLNADNPSGQYLELDGLMRIHKTCVLFEYTAERGSPKEKIKKFIRNCHLFLEQATIPLRQRFELFGVKGATLDDFEDISHWKFVYFGTHPDFDLKRYARNEFPEFQHIAQQLYIFQPSQLEYLRQLTNSIGKFAQSEFLALLDFQPIDFGDNEEYFDLDFIKADGKYIAGESEIKSNVYLLKFKVSQLLKIAKVSRFDGIPFMMEDQSANDNYQRLLIDDKLGKIAEKFIGGNKRKMFPNTLTLALSPECIEVDGKLRIPKKFSSMDIIDGQHRLYGYTRPEVSDDVRAEAEILATAIKFRDTNDNAELITRCAARVFCEVNSTQSQVSQDLLYLIKYDVLKDRDYPAAAGKVLLECDKREGAMPGLFAVNALQKNFLLNKPSINIIKMIEEEIVPFLKGEGPAGFKMSPEALALVFSNHEYEQTPTEYINKAVVLTVRFFNALRSVFNSDWTQNASTLLITENYIIAFFRYFRFQLFNQGREIQDILDVLQDVKHKIDSSTGIKNMPSFDPTIESIPGIHTDSEDIFQFLLNLPSSTEDIHKPLLTN